MSDPVCYLCTGPGLLSCPQCSLRSCCQDHADLHCPGPCYPFTVLDSPGVGRYVVASRDIAQGEEVFGETEPLVVGPNQECEALCLQCLSPVEEGEGQRCAGCGYPVCGAECEDQHTQTRECQVLSTAEPLELKESYHPILPLRLLLLQSQHPAKARLAQMFMDHREEREDTEYFRYGKEKIVPFIREQCGQTQWSEEEIMRVIGILEVNCYEVKNFVTFGVRGFYPLASLLSHSCVANVKTIWQSEPPFGHRTLAVRDIRAGEEILTSYLRPSMCSLVRRRSIRTGWYFDCTCPRCSDPRELGANTNTVTCPACSSGDLLPVQPLHYQSDWRCEQCQEVIASDLVTGVVEKFKDEIQTLYETDRYNVENWLDLLGRAEPYFHPQHMVMIDIAKWLVPVLCRGPGLSFPHFPLDQVQTKLRLATNYLAVLEIVEPGLSKFRAKYLFEMIDTKMFLLSKEFNEGKLAPHLFKGELAGDEASVNGGSALSFSISAFTPKLNDVIEILTLMGVTSPFEQMILTKSSQLRNICKEFISLDLGHSLL